MIKERFSIIAIDIHNSILELKSVTAQTIYRITVQFAGYGSNTAIRDNFAALNKEYELTIKEVEEGE